MLYELAQSSHFLTTWLTLTALALGLMMVMSGALFARYYWRPSYATWQRKTNPKFPAPAMVRRELLQMFKGVYTAALCPALALHLVDTEWSRAYAGLGEYGVGYLIFSFFVVWIGSDLYEFVYHRIGHTRRFLWKQHKPHHVFSNPSPFAVIADGHVDQLIRSAPLLFVPMLMPINMDLMILTYGAFFYAYGVYLHWGFELRWPDAHNPWINSSFQHYVHHARSTLNRPLHTGFFFKSWDRMAGSVYEAGPDACICARCCAARGERTPEAFAAVDKPDYSVLLSPSFWLRGPTTTADPAIDTGESRSNAQSAPATNEARSGLSGRTAA